MPIPILGRGALQRTSVSVTFTGASGLGAAGTTTTFFTITGEVILVYLVPFAVLTLTQNLGTPTLALGVVNATTLFIGATTATTLATGEFWTESTGGGTAEAGIALPAALKDIVISSNIVGTVGGTNNIDGGTLRLDAYWLPLSSSGLVA